jgi:pimeloyl-ACP methyl ester carboxylesterase
MDIATFGPGAKRELIEVSGARIHAVSAGAGDPIVLIAGWPQSLWAWRHVLPALATRYRVFALDPPGLGGSSIPAPAYDVDGVAATLHAAIGKLGLERFHLIGHDIGAWVAYPFAARYRDAVEKLVLIDAVIPGVVPMLPITPQNVNVAWHFGFNQIAELPEALTAGRERAFVSWFFKHRAFVTGAFTPADLDQYESVYSAPGAMASGFNYYRSMGESARQNLAHAATKLTPPVLVIAAAAGVGARMIDAITPLCENARGVVFDQCGHYIPEEAPQRLCAELKKFCG